MSAPGPMTEAAFRQAFVDATAGAFAPAGGVANAAVAAAKAAGVVFAPEAPPLPERLEVTGPLCVRAMVLGAEIVIWEIFRPLDERFGSARKAISEAAVDRYNAYPRLREAAVQADLAGRQLLSACSVSAVRAHPQGMLDAALDALVAALAEGAQP